MSYEMKMAFSKSNGEGGVSPCQSQLSCDCSDGVGSRVGTIIVIIYHVKPS